MADNIDFSLVGIDSLVGKLEAISYDMKRKGGRTALRKAAQVVEAKLKENAERVDDPDSKEKIADNVAIRWSGRTFKATGDLMFRVGILGGAGSKSKASAYDGLPGGDTRHWRLLEFGTEHMAAKPFMRKALADNVSEATNTFITEYEKAIDRAIKRAAKAAGSS
ncbi:HK97-gp10 family putative phage morphogenesis protein [Pseudomonas moraviensis]|uniref:HK97-gp10 family putative phage morphogenesis protein n=1 Tax=Pseudomonas moraviensis TaxID=321662 RepID=UPI00382FE418